MLDLIRNRRNQISLLCESLIFFGKFFKKSFTEDNFRRLNMKGFKSKGYRGGTSKGTKFKRFKWAKNKNKYKLNSKFGSGNDDETNEINYNLLQDEFEEKESKKFEVF